MVDRVLSKVFDNFSIGFISVDTTDTAKVEAAISDDVKAIYIQTPTDPLLGITDLQAISDIADKHGLLQIHSIPLISKDQLNMVQT